MKFTHIRNATTLLEYKGHSILMDPCFAPVNSWHNLPKSYVEMLQLLQKKHPYAPLPPNFDMHMPVDMILCTHNHFDHFGAKALQVLDKSTKFFCQPFDAEFFEKKGFRNITAIKNSTEYNGITLHRTPCDHGKFFKNTSGFVLCAPQEPTIYFAGDTIYTQEIKEALLHYTPDIVVLNAAGAYFLGEKLLMDLEDVEQTMAVYPKAKYVFVHLDTVNHATLTRQDIQSHFTPSRLEQWGVKNIYIPQDGESLHF